MKDRILSETVLGCYTVLHHVANITIQAQNNLLLIYMYYTVYTLGWSDLFFFDLAEDGT